MNRINFLILIFLISCTQQPDNEIVIGKITDNKPQQVSVSPKIFTINPDSLKTFTPGKKGFPKPIVKKADHSNKKVLAGPRKVIPGVSYLKQSKEDIAKGAKAVMSKKPAKFVLNEKPIINTPGKNGFELPVKYEIANPVEIELDNVRNF